MPILLVNSIMQSPFKKRSDFMDPVQSFVLNWSGEK